MAIKIVRNSVNQPEPSAQRRPANRGTQARTSPSEYRQQAQRPQQSRRPQQSSGGGAGKAIAAVIIGIVFLGIVIIAATSKKKTPQTQYRPQPTTRRTGDSRKLQGLDSLGGLTMGEWEKLHNKDNAALKARKSRLRNPKNRK